MTRLGFHHLIQRLGKAAGMAFAVHPPHASARDRIQLGERWARYAQSTALYGTCLDQQHRDLHCDVG